MSAYSEEQKEFIEAHYKDYKFKELTRLFNERFSTNKSLSSIKVYCSKHGLKKTDGNGQFQNNHYAWNKGMTKEEYLEHCTDETREILAHHEPVHIRKYQIGDRVIKKIGNQYIPYVVIALDKNVKFDKRLTPETRYVWERYNGKIPEGNYIMHIDGDVMNNDISNLLMVTEAERNFLVSHKWTGNIEILKTGISIYQLQNTLKSLGRYE